MATSTDAEKLAYVMTVLKNTELPQPNYHGVASDMGVNNANNAQKKFKAIVEQAGFKLINKQIVPKDADGATTPSTPVKKAAPKTRTPASSAKKTPGGGRGTKRKVQEVVSEDEDGASDGKLKEENEEEVEMMGSRGVRARSATVKAEEAVKEETEEED